MIDLEKTAAVARSHVIMIVVIEVVVIRMTVPTARIASILTEVIATDVTLPEAIVIGNMGHVTITTHATEIREATETVVRTTKEVVTSMLNHRVTVHENSEMRREKQETVREIIATDETVEKMTGPVIVMHAQIAIRAGIRDRIAMLSHR